MADKKTKKKIKVAFPHMGNIYIAWGSALRRLGIEPFIPPYSSKRTLSLGTKNSPESICLPYKLILGNFIEAIEGGADYVAMISSPGICRLGEYGAGIQNTLADMGYHANYIELQLYDGVKGMYKFLTELSGVKNPITILRAIVFAFRKVFATDRMENLLSYYRAREITRALVDPEFDGFETKKDLNLYFVCFTSYDETMPNVHIAFKKETLKNTFGEYISKKGYTQLRIAETEKYAHVTFFFNGGEEKQYEGEDRILVPSPKVETYDMKPEMSAYEVTDKVLEAIQKDKYDCIILNYANTDMVGHTGSLPAAIKAVEAVDECVGKVVKLVESKQGNILITADHGNAEQMIDYKTGEPHTAHTTNPVPLILVTANEKLKLKNDGKLADLAPTMLDLMHLEKPEEMTGESLLDEE